MVKTGIGMVCLVIAVAALVVFAAGGQRPAFKDSAKTGAKLVSLRIEDYGAVDTKTELGILIPETGKKLLGVNEEASHIDTFADDKGGVFPGEKMTWFGLELVDGKTVLNVLSWKAPTPGAREITFRGQVAIDAIAHETAVRQKIDLKPGAELASELVDFRVKQVQNVSLDGVKMVIVIQSVRVDGEKHGIFDKLVRDLHYYGPDGKEIETVQISCSGSGTAERETTEITYGLPKRVNSIVVGLKVVDKVEHFTVPIDVRASVGF